MEANRRTTDPTRPSVGELRRHHVRSRNSSRRPQWQLCECGAGQGHACFSVQPRPQHGTHRDWWWTQRAGPAARPRPARIVTRKVTPWPLLVVTASLVPCHFWQPQHRSRQQCRSRPHPFSHRRIRRRALRWRRQCSRHSKALHQWTLSPTVHPLQTRRARPWCEATSSERGAAVRNQAHKTVLCSCSCTRRQTHGHPHGEVHHGLHTARNKRGRRDARRALHRVWSEAIPPRCVSHPRGRAGRISKIFTPNLPNWSMRLPPRSLPASVLLAAPPPLAAPRRATPYIAKRQQMSPGRCL